MRNDSEQSAPRNGVEEANRPLPGGKHGSEVKQNESQDRCWKLTIESAKLLKRIKG